MVFIRSSKSSFTVFTTVVTGQGDVNNNTLNGTVGLDWLVGAQGDDVLNGGPGDVLLGGFETPKSLFVIVDQRKAVLGFADPELEVGGIAGETVFGAN